MRILLAEDDPMIGDSLRKGLRGEGFTVDWVQDGRSAERALETADYALVLLDLGLPGKEGLAVLNGWRRRGLTVPVLILTARDAVPDRVKGLDSSRVCTAYLFRSANAGRYALHTPDLTQSVKTGPYTPDSIPLRSSARTDSSQSGNSPRSESVRHSSCSASVHAVAISRSAESGCHSRNTATSTSAEAC